MSQKPLDNLAGRARPNCAEPGRELKNVFEKHLDFVSKLEYPGHDYLQNKFEHYCNLRAYLHAGKLLEGMCVGADDAHGLLLTRDLSDVERYAAGFFLSAVYNKSESKEIVYDLDVKVENLAFKLSADKAFINTGNGNDSIGTCAQGIIINYAKKSLFHGGFQADGPFITYGGSHYSDHYDEDDLEIEDSCLIVTVKDKVDIRALGSPAIYGPVRFDSIVCSPVSIGNIMLDVFIDRIPELRSYIDNLVGRFEQGRNDYRAVLETVRSLGPKPNETIRQDIETILKGAGKNV